jgi:allophanate hydrolase subunit 2
VTGGYPRILQLTEIAIARVSQKITGDKIQFILEDHS